ncbi:MAG: ATP-dependent Clp protease proteolytic subunit [Opitutales bacterium]|nr:ATP-dependent Clp protease proteolytic subunit [Opitutales bacterium]
MSNDFSMFENTARPRFDEEENENDEMKPPVEPGIEPLMQKRFVKERKIFFWTDTNDEACRKAVEKLLYLEAIDPGKEITFYLNSPGGSITSGMALFDTMRMISSPIKVVVMGMAASMGSILLCAGEKGKRLLFPHARVLIHQPLISGRMMGSAVDINIQALEMEKARAELNGILAAASGQPLEKIQTDTDRDFYMNAKEAIEYGLADGIVESM